jgi:hypothetical protein
VAQKPELSECALGIHSAVEHVADLLDRHHLVRLRIDRRAMS